MVPQYVPRVRYTYHVGGHACLSFVSLCSSLTKQDPYLAVVGWFGPPSGIHTGLVQVGCEGRGHRQARFLHGNRLEVRHRQLKVCESEGTLWLRSTFLYPAVSVIMSSLSATTVFAPCAHTLDANIQGRITFRGYRTSMVRPFIRSCG